jgi:hypothetical protein
VGSFTREQYEEVYKTAVALYRMVLDGELTGAHRHKMKAKALAEFIMEQCEGELLPMTARPACNPNGAHAPLEMSKDDLAQRLGRAFRVRT